jgi:Acetyl-CoA dehydrogenase C-terminal like/Acyl-CoA dehydrogenase, C-terminal domain
MRAYNEGCRMLGGWVSRALDAERHADDPEVRARAEDFVALMTPIVKALFTDLGHETAHLAVQVYGGHGYIRESGVEQYARDARIAMIYEGTNGIQALDLVGRKLGANNGRLLRSFFHPVSAFIEANKGDGPMKPMIDGLEKAFGALQLSTATIAQRGLSDPEEAGAAASEYLRLFGLVAMGYCFARATMLSGMKIAFGAEDKAFYDAKIKTATFFFERVLPQTATAFLQIKAGKKSMMALAEDGF